MVHNIKLKNKFIAIHTIILYYSIYLRNVRLEILVIKTIHKMNITTLNAISNLNEDKQDKFNFSIYILNNLYIVRS